MVTGVEVAFAIVSGLAINEVGEWCPWLARRLVRWSARVRYRGHPRRAAQRIEELEALVEARPGKLFKLVTAVGFAAAVAPRAVVAGRRRRRGEQRVGLVMELSTHEAAVVATYGGQKVYTVDRRGTVHGIEGGILTESDFTNGRRYFVAVESFDR